MHRLGNRKRGWQVSRELVDLRRSAGPSITVTMEAQPQQVKFDLERTAIIVVDMQNDFCTVGGWLDSIGVDTSPLLGPVEPLNRLLPVLRRCGVPVIWLNWGNRPDRINLSPSVLHVYNPDGESKGIGDLLEAKNSRVLEKGSWGAALVEGLQPDQEDIHVDKFRMSGFWDTPLDSILRNMDIHTVLFAGVNLDQCVMHTLQDAVCLGYDAILLNDCCETSSPQYCKDATVYNIKQCYGFIAQSSSLLDAVSIPERKGEEQ